VKKLVSKSTSFCFQTAVALARGKPLEKVTVGVTGVLDNLLGLLLAPLLVQVCYICELTAAYFLSSFDHSLSLI